MLPYSLLRRATGGLRLSRFYSAASKRPPPPSTPPPPAAGQTPRPAAHHASRPQADPSTAPAAPTAHPPTGPSRGDGAMALPRSLPEPSPHGATAAEGGQGQPLPQLRVGGDGLKLGSLGPLVVNPDGSVGRVANWAEMTAGEREATLRLLGRRNQERLRVLREEKDREEEGSR